MLLGKKSVNCLSCNKGEDVRGAGAHIKGQDGRLYWGATGMQKRGSAADGLTSEHAQQDTMDDMTNFKSGSPRSSNQRMAGSRSNVLKNNSVSISMGNQGNFHFTEDHSNSLSRAGMANRGIGLKRHAAKGRSKIETDLIGMDKKYELRQQIESKGGKFHKRSNTSAQYPFKMKQQQRLPIGYRVQQEKRSEL